MNEPQARFDVGDLVAFAAALFRGAGADDDKASVVAALLAEADLMGHTTHGLQLGAPYLRALQDGKMLGQGEPGIVTDSPAAVVWDGRYLPGVWLAARTGLTSHVPDVRQKRIALVHAVTAAMAPVHAAFQSLWQEAELLNLLAEAASSLGDCDALMLAHFSTPRARSAAAAAVDCPVLTSPATAVDRLRGLLV